MALLASELQRLRAELGYNVLNVGAEPYIGVSSVFDQVIQPYTLSGASTTSSTAVVAATSPTPVAVTLASATGFAAGAQVIVDVDDRQERATVQSLSGPAMTVLLSKAHTGSYPVTVEGGESLIRAALARCVSLGLQILTSASSAGIKKVDEIEFFPASDASGMGAASGGLWRLREREREELAELLGIPYLRGVRRGSGGMIGVF